MKNHPKIVLKIINTEGGRLGYASDASFVTIETIAEYENGAIFGIENVAPFFASTQELTYFVQLMIQNQKGSYKSFSWEHVC